MAEDGTSLLTTVLKITFAIVFFILFLYVLVITILSPILWQKYNQALVDATLNSGQITVDWTIVHPRAITDENSNEPPVVVIESNVSFTQTGPLPATLKSGNFNAHWLGFYLGYMETPQQIFAGNQEPLLVHQFTNFTIMNTTAYHQQAAIVANGGTIYWRFSGYVELSLKQYGISFDFKVYMIKDIQIVGKTPIGMKSFDIQPIRGEPNVLWSISNQTFINPSNIGAQDLGNITMLIYNEDDVYIGNAYIPNLDLKIGENFQQGIISSAIVTNESKEAIGDMLSKWAMGIDQKFRAFGPVNATSGFTPLFNTSNQHFTIVGNKVPLIQNATVGPMITANQILVNPTGMSVTNSNMTFVVSIPSLSNGMYVSFNISGQNILCPASSQGLLLEYTPGGMPGYSTPLTLPPFSNNQTIQFGPASKQYCANYLPIAVCCGISQGVFTGIPKSPQTFMARAEGHVTITVEEFTFRQYYAQDVPTTCLQLNNTGMCAFVSNICEVPQLGLYCSDVTAGQY